MKKVCLSVVIAIFMVAEVFAQPSLQVIPDTLKFGCVSRGGTHQRPLVLKNIGTAALIIDSAWVNPAFQLSPSFGQPIAPGDSIVLTARFYPTQEIPYSDAWHFYSNDPQRPNYSLIVSAKGVRVFAPGEAIWSFQHIGDVVCVAATQDYDNDGFPDAAAEGFDTGVTGDNLVSFSGSGDGNSPNILWSARPLGGPSNSGGWGDGCLAAASDLNSDGYNDLLLGTAWGSRTIFAINGKSGGTIWSYDTYQNLPSGWIYSVTQTSDNNGDGIPEVLAAAGSDANSVYGLDGASGQLIWQQPVEDAVMSVVSLRDINGDGKDEAAFGVADNGTRAYCYSGASVGNGTPLWNFSIGTSTFWTSAIQDINNDGYDDVLCGTWSSGNYIYAFNGHRFGNGQVLWRVSVGQPIMRVVACPDLNGDGKQDILIASWASYALALSGATGSEIWRGYAGDDVWAVDYTGDLTGDGIPEVIYGSFTGTVHCVNGVDGAELWQFTNPYKIFSLRGIGDVNGDGFSDVLVGTQYLSSGGTVYLVSGGQVQTGINDNAPNIPRGYLTAAAYPNPFNSSTMIKFALENESDYLLSVYDITGRLVKTFNGRGQAGGNSVGWSVSEKESLPSGVYLYRLSANNQTVQGKVTLLK